MEDKKNYLCMELTRNNWGLLKCDDNFPNNMITGDE